MKTLTEKIEISIEIDEAEPQLCDPGCCWMWTEGLSCGLFDAPLDCADGEDDTVLLRCKKCLKAFKDET